MAETGPGKSNKHYDNSQRRNDPSDRPSAWALDRILRNWMTVILPVSSLCFLLGFPYRFILAERFPIVKAYKLGQYVESGDSWGDGF